MAVPRQSDFLIGWICILRKEYSAAMDVLDETYGTNEEANFVSSSNDTNKYQLGRIEKHSVVINIPKSGASGLIPAYKIASNMKSTFPCIRYILLVGLGGGAPSTKFDVRLGDVVVGTSVSQYKKGSMFDFRIFKSTGQSETPPGELSGAVTELEDELQRGRSLEQSMNDIFRQKIHLRDMYARPTEDRLLLADYSHSDKGCVCLGTQLNDGYQLVNREQRAPEQLVKIHTGTIGSLDADMERAKERDRVSHQQDIICFEMGAAELMHSTRSISVRGISHYSDGHKNDLWQDYAALTAAVCAKELLKWLTPESVFRSTMQLKGDELQRLVLGTVGEVLRKISQSQQRNWNSTTPIKEADEILKERLDYLACFTRHPTQENKMKTAELMCDLQKKLEGSVQDLQAEVDNQAATSDFVSRAELEELKQQINNTANKFDDWGKTCQKMLDTASEMAKYVSEPVENKYSKLFISKSGKSGSGKKNESCSSDYTHIGVSYQLSAPPTFPREGSSQGRSRSGRTSYEQDPNYPQKKSPPAIGPKPDRFR